MVALANEYSLEPLYSRLSDAGVSKDYLRQFVLPVWWKDEIASDRGGYSRAIGLIHSHLNIPLDVLWNGNARIECPKNGRVSFKRAANASEDDVRWARCVGVSAATLAIEAMSPSSAAAPVSAVSIRDRILAAGEKYVSLRNLVGFLWEKGIPVLHIDEFPGKKMAALAVRAHGRFAIVLAKAHKFSDCMLFDLAHEAGHIFSGHLNEDGVLVDAEIKQDESSDSQEAEANAFAVAVLTGDANRVYKGSFFKAQTLAKWATSKSVQDRVSPGVIAQNLAFHSGRFWLANKVASLLEPEGRPIQLIRSKMAELLHWQNLDDDSSEFLMRIAGKGAEDAVPARY